MEQATKTSSTYNFKFDPGLYYYDDNAGSRVVRFIEKHCRHTRGHFRGQLIVLEEWQKEIIHEAFGVKKKKNGFRKYNYIYIEVPKKNGKSTLLAPITLYLLCADNEPGAEVVAAAGDKDQARIVFNTSKEMVELSPYLKKGLTVLRDTIYHPKSGSDYKVLSAEAHTKHGPNLHGICFDELHVQPNSELFDTLTKGIAARRQPFVFMITTAGITGTFAHERHEYAKNILNGNIKDPRWLVRIFCADPDDDIYSTETHRKANPGFGTIIPEDYFEGEITELRNKPTRENSFKRLHLNIWTGSEVGWLALNIWDKCNQVQNVNLKGRECFGGMDLASKRDLCSLSLIFPPTEEDPLIHWLSFFWCPKETVLERDKQENVHYSEWVKDKRILTTPGDVTDYNFIESEIMKLADEYQIQEIGFDRYRATQTVTNLINKGLEMSPVPQTATYMTTPVESLEVWILKEQINHFGCPVLRWQSGNLILKEDHNKNKQPDKKRSKDKIDGMVSGLIAMQRFIASLTDDKDKGPSVYEERGITVI